MVKLLIEQRKLQKSHKKIIQTEFQMIIIKKIPKERYISRKERQKIIDNLRLI